MAELARFHSSVDDEFFLMVSEGEGPPNGAKVRILENPAPSMQSQVPGDFIAALEGLKTQSVATAAKLQLYESQIIALQGTVAEQKIKIETLTKNLETPEETKELAKAVNPTHEDLLARVVDIERQQSKRYLCFYGGGIPPEQPYEDVGRILYTAVYRKTGLGKPI